MNGTSQIDPPPIAGKISNNDLLSGKPVTPLKHLTTLSDEDFTEFILHWASGYLKKTYDSVRRCDGAGDKGRDIIGILKTDKNKWENYQCKNYKNTLYPSDIYVEIGKLLHYTFTKQYTIPENYYFVSPREIGPTLLDLLKNPDQLKNNLINKWDDNCKKKITSKKEIALEGDFRKYIDDFDFSIFKSKSPQELIDEMFTTSYYAYWFGISRPKPRPQTSTPSLSDKENELEYVKQLIGVYKQETSIKIDKINDLKQEPKLDSHFHRQRVCFYCAEALKEFARDSWPVESKVFESLMDEIFYGVSTRMTQIFGRPIQRVDSILELSTMITLTSNPLIGNLEIQDRQGICHHLVNEKRISWTE